MSYPCVGKGIGFSCTLYDLSCPHDLTQMAILLIHTPVFTVLGPLLSSSLATALVQPTITYGHRLCAPPTALSLLHISVGEIWKHKSDVCHTAAQSGSQCPPRGQQAPCNLVLAGPLPHPFPVHLSLCLLHYTGCHLVLPGTYCAGYLLFLPSGIPMAPPSLPSGFSSEGFPPYLMKETPLPSTLAPSPFSLFSLARNTTKIASVFIMPLSPRGWKPHEERNIICLGYLNPHNRS